jgi:hypothetical protein
MNSFFFIFIRKKNKKRRRKLKNKKYLFVTKYSYRAPGRAATKQDLIPRQGFV